MPKPTRQFTLTSANGIKSLPIDAFPANVWESVLGTATTSDIYKLYDAVPWLYRAIQTIIEAINGLPRNEEDLEALPVNVQWSNFLDEVVGDYLLTGAMFCIIEDNKYGKSQELRRFHPDAMELVTDSQYGLVGFKRKLGANEIPFKRGEIGYAWIPSRENEIAIGTSPAQNALKAAGLLMAIDTYGKKYFDSGAINPTMVEIPGFEAMPAAEQERTSNIFKRMFSAGMTKAHEVFPISSETKVHALGSPMSELAVGELTDKKREDISTSLGIPQSLLFSSAANYATAREDNKHFYQKTVIPLARKIEGMINPYFLNHNINIQLEFREQELDLFQADEAQRSDSLANLVNVGIPLVTALEILGYDLNEEQWAAVRSISDTQDEPLQMEDGNIPAVSVTEDDIIEVRSFKPVVSIATHLDQWETKATKAFKRVGNAEVNFESHLIPESLQAAIRGHLSEIEIRSEISDVFKHAIDLTDHHAESEY